MGTVVGWTLRFVGEYKVGGVGVKALSAHALQGEVIALLLGLSVMRYGSRNGFCSFADDDWGLRSDRLVNRTFTG